jgi:transposase
MDRSFTFSQFLSQFPDDASCLDEIKRLRYPKGIHCILCNNKTYHYKLTGRTAYSCKFCRNQIYPLADTIFEKTTTPLRLWFYAMFLMTHTKGSISAKQIQRELGVTYKTAWRILHSIRMLMEQNNGDLLRGTIEIEELYRGEERKSKIRKWILFNKLEITLVEKQESSP